MGTKNQRVIIPGNGQYLGSRQQQQDSFGFSDISNASLIEKVGVMAVLADGMGGMANGREASTIAVHTMIEEYSKKLANESFSEAIIRAIHTANINVLNLSKDLSKKEQTGTTLTAVAVYEDSLYYVSVGDSHIYLFRNNKLICLNKDHVYAVHLAEEAAAGRMTLEEVITHPERKYLTSYLGIENLKEIDISTMPITVYEGDRVLLCSDGFYNSLEEEEIIDAMQYEPQYACDLLIEKIISKNLIHQDNATVAMILIE